MNTDVFPTMEEFPLRYFSLKDITRFVFYKKVNHHLTSIIRFKTSEYFNPHTGNYSQYRKGKKLDLFVFKPYTLSTTGYRPILNRRVKDQEWFASGVQECPK